MTLLIVATSAKPIGIEQEIQTGRRPRLDYLELSACLKADYVDYDPAFWHYPSSLHRLEEKLRLDVFWARQLARKVRMEKYDSVLSMSERIGIPLAYGLDRKVKHVVILHHPISSAKLNMMKLLNIGKRWDALLALSQAEADFLRSNLKVEEERVGVLHSVVDTQFFRIAGISASGGQDDYVFSLGVTNRDYLTLINALRELPEIPCHISSTSAWVAADKGLDAQRSLPANVLLKDYNHPEVIRDAYAGCRFVVIPLRAETTQWSAGSTSLLQPQAMGKAVIATRIPGLTDYVVDGETGILVEGNNSEAMAEAIRYLWEHPEIAAEMGRRGREWVSAHFSYEAWLKRVEQILEGDVIG